VLSQYTLPPGSHVPPSLGWTQLPRCLRSASTLGSMSELKSGIDAVVRRHVPDARLLSCAGGEIAFRLPKSDAAKCVPSRLHSIEVMHHRRSHDKTSMW